MDYQSSAIQQSFGVTVLDSGAVANQGYFQQFVLPPSLIPEFVTHLQQRLTAENDANNPVRIYRSVFQLGFLNKHERVTLAGPDARRVLDSVGNILQALSPLQMRPISSTEERIGNKT